MSRAERTLIIRKCNESHGSVTADVSSRLTSWQFQTVTAWTLGALPGAGGGLYVRHTEHAG
jgi:hypothetical protein